MKTTTKQPVAVNHREAAAMLGIGPRTMTRYIRTGQLPAAKLGGTWFIPTSALNAVCGKAN